MKRLILVFLVISLMSSFTPVFAEETTEKAKVLYDMGLLKGVGNTFSVEALELSRDAKRIEICVTIVRMLGKEEKALYQNNAHPFEDVPAWASPYVGWLYENHLVNGIDDKHFGTNSIATTKQFCAMILRVLGYSEKEGHFLYEDAVYEALFLNLLTNTMSGRDALSRENMVIICYNALKTNIRNSKRTLLTKLCDEAAVDKALAEKSGILKKPSLSNAFPSVPETLGNITLQNFGTMVNLVFDTPCEEYGLRVYAMDEAGILKELKNYGTPFFRKGEISYIGGGAAGYVKEIKVLMIEEGKKFSFIVVKTTSEGELFDIIGKSSVVTN